MSESRGSSGIGLTTTIIIVLVILKLVGVEPIVSWSWVAVIIGPIVAVLAFWIVFFGLILGVGGAVMGLFAGGSALSNAAGRRSMEKLNRKADKEDG